MSTYKERRPVARLLVRFAGPVHRDRRHECWVIETPDGDRYVERKADWRWHASLLHGWPEGFRGDAVRFRGEIGREALRQMVLEGRDLARGERRRRRLPAALGRHLGEEPSMMVDWHGDECGLDGGLLDAARRRVSGKRGLTDAPRVPEAPGDEAATRPDLGAPALEDAESVLLVAELHAGGGLALGDEVTAHESDLAVGSKVIGRRPDGRPVLCERAAIGEVASWRAQALDNAGVSDPFDVASPELRSSAIRAARDEADRLAALGRGRVLAAGGRGAGGCEDVAGALEPELRELDVDVAAPLGRRDRARVRRLANDGLASSNWLHGADRRPPAGPVSWATRCRVAELQHETQRRAQTLAASWGAPACADDPQQRLSQLLRGRGGCAQLAHATLTPFFHARLSVPDDLAGAPRVSELLPTAARMMSKGFESHTWAWRGCRARRCQAGIFFVKKKGGRQRLILDCRPAGRLFRSPPGVDLVSGDGLSRIERWTTSGADRGEEPGGALGGLGTWLGVSDVKDCFHRLLLDDGPGLQECFGYPSLRAAELGLAHLEGEPLARDALVHPLARALPMGWAWSLCFAPSRPTRTSLGHYTYVDNIGVLGGSESQVQSALGAATSSFGGVGLEVHETSLTNAGGGALGVQLDGQNGHTRPAPSRFWRVRGAVQALLRRRAVSGLELEIAGLMIFLRADWGARWMPGLYQTDASLDGFGVAYSLWGPREVGSVGRTCERARYRLGAGAARQHAVEAAGLELLADGGIAAPAELERAIPEAEVARWCQDPTFEEVPAELLHADRWRTVLADRWALEGGVLHLEGRALIKAVERVAGIRAGHDGRALLLGGNMAVVLAFSRSRARDFKLLTMFRRAAACSFSRWLRFSYRWIPSEFNSSDEGADCLRRSTSQKSVRLTSSLEVGRDVKTRASSKSPRRPMEAPPALGPN
ncbi:unnamed protein product [Prorocentrum cordatum]|uniref:Uncharacterized protein n=1 Tax=Prorocentrum cordatum TaxID=2364126 RepID=A0ABN9Y2Y6_9DINO|nr:unnamed protein product [Polarella glacialis]